jgi:hypothetical protein
MGITRQRPEPNIRVMGGNEAMKKRKPAATQEANKVLIA